MLGLTNNAVCVVLPTFYQAPGWAAVGVEGGAKQRSQLPEWATCKALSHAQILFCSDVFVPHCFSGLQNQGDFLLGHLARVSGVCDNSVFWHKNGRSSDSEAILAHLHKNVFLLFVELVAQLCDPSPSMR